MRRKWADYAMSLSPAAVAPTLEAHLMLLNPRLQVLVTAQAIFLAASWQEELLRAAQDLLRRHKSHRRTKIYQDTCLKVHKG